MKVRLRTRKVKAMRVEIPMDGPIYDAMMEPMPISGKGRKVAPKIPNRLLIGSSAKLLQQMDKMTLLSRLKEFEEKHGDWAKKDWYP